MIRILIAALAAAVMFSPVPAAGTNTPAGTERADVVSRSAGLYAPESFLAVKQHGRFVYFLYDAPARIETFDLGALQWLPMIVLPPGPTAFDRGPTTLVVAFGSIVYAFDTNGTGQRLLRTVDTPVVDLFVTPTFALVIEDRKVSSIDILDGSVIDTVGRSWPWQGSSFDGAFLFFRNLGGVPSDILRVPVAADGELGVLLDSPYHGDFAAASQTFALPLLSAATDDSGIVYDAVDLTYRGSLAGPVSDLGSDEGSIVLLRDGRFVMLGANLLRTGEFQPALPPLRLFVFDAAAYALFWDSGFLAMERIPFSSFTRPQPGVPPDPDGLDFTPDKIRFGPDGTAYLLSALHRAVFAWSPGSRDWLATLPLLGPALDIALSADETRLYLSYARGEITVFDLTLAEPVELPFVNSPETPCGLATAGEFLFVCDPAGSGVSHFTYDAQGARISWEDWLRRPSLDFVWSEPRRKMYHFQDGYSPNDLLWEEIGTDGALGTVFDSPYHGDYPMVHPIRLDPAHARVLIGSGHIFDAVSLVHLGALPWGHTDAAWLGDELFTIRAENGDTRLWRWSPDLEPLDSRRLPGQPLRLQALADRLLVVTLHEQKPRFWLRLPNLDGELLALSKTDGRTSAFPGEPLTYAISAENLSTGLLEAVRVVDFFPFGLEEISWSCVPRGGAVCDPGPWTGDVDTVVDLPAGGRVEITAQASIRSDIVGTLRNRASAFVGANEEAAAADATDVLEPPLLRDGFESGGLDAWLSL